MTIYPLKFEPILKSIVWGGGRIARYKKIRTDLDNIGESWELSGVQGNESVVTNGEYRGQTITDLVRRFKGELVGRKNYEKTGDEFPLLVKFIDAKQDLSIQVHPDDVLAAERHNGSKGKTEMWYVIGADEGAHLMSGLSQKITPEEYVERVGNNTITEVLRDYPLSPGDVFFLPAGRIHSIGAGSFIAEIQQTSDITYRIYDFGRLGLDGRPRELHTEQAKDAIDYTVLDDYRTYYASVPGEENLLVHCDYFTTSLVETDRAFSKDLSGIDSFLILICTSGTGTVTDSEGNSETIRQGETILIPAAARGITVVPEGSIAFLTVTVI